MDVYDDMQLYITPEKFYIEPRLGSNLLVIDRVSETISLQNRTGQIPAASSSRAFCGLLGSIKLLSGRYLVLATHREHIGVIAGHEIWRLAGTELLPYCRSTLHLNTDELEDNATYISMIAQVLATPYFYFSYSYDITHTLQRLHSTGPDFLTQTLLERADQRFVWNNYLLQNFQRREFHSFCLPIIHGFMFISQCSVNGCNFTWCLVSRRSVNRSGTRLFKRGVDNAGYVANFVETEQIIEYQGDRASFVQIRGSIPLYWAQLPDLRYKPPPRLIDLEPEEQRLACSRHLETQSYLYGRQVLLDLVDQKGAEGKLQSAYKNMVHSLANPSIRYEPFDFHAECRHMRWDRLSILLDRIAFDQDEMGFFLLLRDGSLASLQDGVFRTNCVDCLDRTNVVQSMLARRSLNAVLVTLGILRPGQTVEQQIALEKLFKEVWADNADLISIQYSGTGALKTDFTRTGKRTKVGLLKDGINSLTRYYKNNFCDGFRQDALDLFHGYADVRTPLRVKRGWRYITFPSVLLVAISMFVASAIFPSEYSTESLLFLLFWGSMVVVTGSTILRYGPEFVDRPRLCAL